MITQGEGSTRRWRFPVTWPSIAGPGLSKGVRNVQSCLLLGSSWWLFGGLVISRNFSLYPAHRRELSGQLLGGVLWAEWYCVASSPGASLVTQVVKNLPLMQETQIQSLGQEDPLEKEVATHSSFIAWEIPWTEEPGGLQSIGSQSRAWLSNFHLTSISGGKTVQHQWQLPQSLKESLGTVLSEILIKMCNCFMSDWCLLRS